VRVGVMGGVGGGDNGEGKGRIEVGGGERKWGRGGGSWRGLGEGEEGRGREGGAGTGSGNWSSERVGGGRRGGVMWEGEAWGWGPVKLIREKGTRGREKGRRGGDGGGGARGCWREGRLKKMGVGGVERWGGSG